LVVVAFLLVSTAHAYTLTDTTISLPGLNTKWNVTCTATFDVMKWGLDWLYVEDLTTDSPIMTRSLTFNYTQLSSVPVVYDCDSFPYPEWVGSAAHDGGGGGGSSTIPITDYEDDVVVINDEPAVDEPSDSEPAPSLFEQAVEVAKKAFGINSPGTGNGGGSGSPDDSGIPDDSAIWKIPGADFARQYWLHILGGLAGLFVVIYAWVYAKAVLAWFFRALIYFGKALLYVLVPMLKLAIAGLGILWAFTLTPIGLVVIGILAAAIYVAIKLYVL